MKNKILINDPRLTPTMERIRSGRVQLFREKNPNDRSFINADNCDLSLEHENKAMYAELIDGQWYWVSGCAECNGKERDWMTYIECEEHDRCRVCEINRKDLTEPPWGGKKGWICKPCETERMADVRRKAFEKLDGEEPDCVYMDKIICPHCGSELDSSDIYESQDMECHVCEGEIDLEVEWTATYSTSIKGERVTQ